MDVVGEIVKTGELVEKILSEDVRARNSDKWLTYRVFQFVAESRGQKIFLPFDLFSEFPSFETVRRTRQKIQNSEGRFLPTLESVRVRRGVREKVFSAWAGSGLK